MGCDYWPPTLQDEIEQLRAEIRTLTMEKTQLQAQVVDLARVKEELQGQMDDLSRTNREKGVIISGLQSQLEAVRIKAVKAMNPRGPSTVPFGMRNFDHYRIRSLLYAGRPNWNLLPTITP